jgi:hypothetical protein
MYCHPEWLRKRDRLYYYAKQRKLTRAGKPFVEGWRGKVLLKAGWVELCVESGRLLVGKDERSRADV